MQPALENSGPAAGRPSKEERAAGSREVGVVKLEPLGGPGGAAGGAGAVLGVPAARGQAAGRWQD